MDDSRAVGKRIYVEGKNNANKYYRGIQQSKPSLLINKYIESEVHSKVQNNYSPLRSQFVPYETRTPQETLEAYKLHREKK